MAPRRKREQTPDARDTEETRTSARKETQDDPAQAIMDYIGDAATGEPVTLVVTRLAPRVWRGVSTYGHVCSQAVDPTEAGCYELIESIRGEFGGGTYKTQVLGSTSSGKPQFRKGSAHFAISGPPRIPEPERASKPDRSRDIARLVETLLKKQGGSGEQNIPEILRAVQEVTRQANPQPMGGGMAELLEQMKMMRELKEIMREDEPEREREIEPTSDASIGQKILLAGIQTFGPVARAFIDRKFPAQRTVSEHELEFFGDDDDGEGWDEPGTAEQVPAKDQAGEDHDRSGAKNFAVEQIVKRFKSDPPNERRRLMRELLDGVGGLDAVLEVFGDGDDGDDGDDGEPLGAQDRVQSG